MRAAETAPPRRPPLRGRKDRQLDLVYAAIADPTRRAILVRLSQGSANVGSLVERFPMSFNGVSKHVKVLERAGLVVRSVHGREHRLRLQAAPLRQAAAWLTHYQAFWNARLDALEALVTGRVAHASAARPGKRSHEPG